VKNEDIKAHTEQYSPVLICDQGASNAGKNERYSRSNWPPRGTNPMGTETHSANLPAKDSAEFTQ